MVEVTFKCPYCQKSARTEVDKPSKKRIKIECPHCGEFYYIVAKVEQTKNIKKLTVEVYQDKSLINSTISFLH